MVCAKGNTEKWNNKEAAHIYKLHNTHTYTHKRYCGCTRLSLHNRESLFITMTSPFHYTERRSSWVMKQKFWNHQWRSTGSIFTFCLCSLFPPLSWWTIMLTFDLLWHHSLFEERKKWWLILVIRKTIDFKDKLCTYQKNDLVTVKGIQII